LLSVLAQLRHPRRHPYPFFFFFLLPIYGSRFGPSKTSSGTPSVKAAAPGRSRRKFLGHTGEETRRRDWISKRRRRRRSRVHGGPRSRGAIHDSERCQRCAIDGGGQTLEVLRKSARQRCYHSCSTTWYGMGDPPRFYPIMPDISRSKSLGWQPAVTLEGQALQPMWRGSRLNRDRSLI